MDRQTHGQIDTRANWHSHKYADTQTDGQTDRQTHLQIDKRTNVQMDAWTDGHTDRLSFQRTGGYTN